MSDFRGLDRRKRYKRRVFISLCKKTKVKIQESLDKFFRDKLTTKSHSLPY